MALYVEVLTDNRNRTSSEVRALFRAHGGSLAEPGAVAWQFRRGGVITVAGAVDEEELMMATLDAGAEDIVDEGDTWRVTCAPTDLPAVTAALEAAEIAVENAESTMLPTQAVPVTSTDQARSVLRLVGELDDHDDVQEVYANFDIPDEILQDLAASV